MKIRKTNKFLYYVRNILLQLVPKQLYELSLQRRLNKLSQFNRAVLLDRVNYYNKLEGPATLGFEAMPLKHLNVFEKPREYKFDAYNYTRFFNSSYKVNFIFGDVIHTAPYPSLQKSRPVKGDNTNAVLLKLNKARHFVFVNDTKPFAAKENKLVGRASVVQKHRMRFMDLYFDHPLCNLGQVNKKGGDLKWLKPKLSIKEHLDYKFILSLEGNDVATNLKWIMSSNSIAVMPKPKYETWFMEGRLIPDYHYIQIRNDYADLEEKLLYYIEHEEEAQAIVANANNYTKQFLNKELEDLISLFVLNKYFYYTYQTKQYKLWRKPTWQFSHLLQNA